MDALHYRQLQTEAFTRSIPEASLASAQEQLRFEQLAFNAVCRATESANAARFITTITDELDSQYSWVSQVAPEDIRHLSLTIDLFKEDYYTRNQKLPSPQHTYRHVRMKVETDTPTPQDEQSVLLLEALMNGDIRSGTIPKLPKFLA
ncbi:MAG: hypothetical protein ACREGE_00700 [Candidatus Microsaccharimonas sp.]